MVRVNMINPLPSGTPMYETYRWQDESKCQDAAPRDLLQFTNGYTGIEVGVDLIKRYCRKCPVRTECFKWAKEDNWFSGIAGGAIFSGAKHAGAQRRVITREFKSDEDTNAQVCG